MEYFNILTLKMSLIIKATGKYISTSGIKSAAISIRPGILKIDIVKVTIMSA